MLYFLYFLIFISGASIASFLSVFLERGNVWGRSMCTNCLRKLNFFELVPVFSYIFLRGKCRACKTHIPVKLFAGEIALGLWYVGSYLSFMASTWLFVMSCILGSVFYLLVLEDIEDMEVSKIYIYILLTIGATTAIILLKPIGILVSILIFSPFWIIFLINRNWIGQADPYVYTSLGLFFGPQFSLSLFLYSIWSGSFFGILYLALVHKKFERGVRIPFLPIIFFSTLLILLTNFHIIKIADILFIYEGLHSY